MEMQAAVLTGDLIGSSTAPPAAVEKALALIEATLISQSQILETDIRFQRFRGDAWQCYCREASQVFRLTVLLLATLRAHPDIPSTRIAAATGDVLSIPQQGLGAAMGEAFLLSGHALDGMNSRDSLVFATGPSMQMHQPWQMALFSMLDWIATRWTPEQAQAIEIAFRHNKPSPRSVDAELAITRQAAASRLKGAGYGPLLDAVNAFQHMEGRHA